MVREMWSLVLGGMFGEWGNLVSEGFFFIYTFFKMDSVSTQKKKKKSPVL